LIELWWVGILRKNSFWAALADNDGNKNKPMNIMQDDELGNIETMLLCSDIYLYRNDGLQPHFL